MMASVDDKASKELVKNPPSLVHGLTASNESKDHVDISKIIDCERFSNLNKLLQVKAYLFRFIHRCKNKSRSPIASSKVPVMELTSEEVKEAELIRVKSIQLSTLAKAIIDVKHVRQIVLGGSVLGFTIL